MYSYACLTILNKLTVIQHEIASRIIKIIDPMTNDVIEYLLVKMLLNKISNFDRKLIIHYTYETWLTAYNIRTLLLLQPIVMAFKTSIKIEKF